MLKINIEVLNKELRHKRPDDIIEWALGLTQKRIVTTSFGVHSAALLSTIHKKDKNIDVVWCDTRLNLSETYDHASYLINMFNLKINIYSPLTKKHDLIASRDIPHFGDSEHQEISEIYKLEPFRRALNEHQPELWFTNIRVRQTEYRDSKDILSYSKKGILKVSPFYYWSDADLDHLLIENELPKNDTYFDPIKGLIKRECGIHLH